MNIRKDTQLASNEPQVLLVASPEDISLIEQIMSALHASHIQVRLADTIGIAARADEFALSIVILRPGKWRTNPLITTVMRSNPRYMIPVMTEPMSLPAGAWSTEALLIKEPFSETIHELAIRIDQQLQIAAKDRKQQKVSSTSNTISYHKTGRNLRSVGKYVPLGIVLILLIGLLVYYTQGKHPTSVLDTNTQAGGAAASVSAFKQSNKVSVPGPGCNTNNRNWWGASDHFKITGTPTSKSTAAPLAKTPTPQVITDYTILTTCQQHALYVQHTNYYHAFAEIFFRSDTQEILPRHFTTQVTATALNPSATAAFELGVNHQKSSYGDDKIEVGVNGYWNTTRINDTTDEDGPPFTHGFVKPTHTMILGAEVDGPRITFSINGQKVTTIVDTAFPNGYSINFGLSDRDAKSAPSALYSNFSYQPLPDTKLSTQSAVATATVQANKNLHTIYTAPIPGLGCDRGPGQWQPVTKRDNYSIATCQAHALAISQEANAQYNGYTAFYGLDGNLPTNYSVKVQIDISQLPGGCAGLITRVERPAAGYNFVVCSTGYWEMQRYDKNGGKGHLLSEGYVNPQTVYTMVATSNGDLQSLALDGVIVSTVHDATLQSTNRITLAMHAGQGTAGNALFSNFVFTPLP